MADPTPTPKRRGRPRADELAKRQEALLQVALAELVECGYSGVTFQGLATRAGVSKETIYSWYGGVDGIFAALIERQADAAIARVRGALEAAADGGGDKLAILTEFATGLLTLLVGQESIALNRAAMASPELSAVLLQSGRHRIGPLMEEYLQGLADAGELAISDPPAAFGALYGLIIQDTQIGVLLGNEPPSPAAISARAATAAENFLRLTRPSQQGGRAAPDSLR